MKCPMQINSYGNINSCQTEDCAWWDHAAHQCCIKTLALNAVFTRTVPVPAPPSTDTHLNYPFEVTC